MTSDPQDAALEGLLTRVRTVVAQPGGGRDEELLAAFRELQDPDEQPGPTSEMRARTAALPDTVAERLSYSVASRVPGGTFVHRTIARATRRQEEALLKEIRDLAIQVKDLLLELTDAAPPSAVRSAARATSQIQAVVETVAIMEGRLATMLRRIEALEERLEHLS